MAPKCSICIHPKRVEIDRQLLAESASLRDMAGQFDVSRTALGRHRKAHLSDRMAEVAERNTDADVRTAIDVRGQLKTINGVTLGILKRARDAGDGSLALQAIDRVQKQIELQARLIDLLKDGTTVNVVVSPQWIELRTLIISSLKGHPDARQAVTGALQSIERGLGHDRVA